MSIRIGMAIAALLVTSSSAAQAYRYEMVPIWSIDADRGDDVIFGRIEDVVIDARNNAYVLDSQLVQVRVIDAEGKLRTTLGREGDGPGELRAPGSLVLMPAGTLGAVSRQFSRITTLDPESGEPRGAVLLEGMDSPLIQLGRVHGVGAGGGDRKPGLVGIVGEPQITNRGKLDYRVRMSMAVFPCVPGGDPVPPLREILEVGLTQGKDVEEENYFRLWEPWTALDGGLIAVAPYWSEYLIWWIDLDGTVRAEARRPFAHRPRTDAEKRRLLNFLWGGISPAEFGIELVPSETEAAIRSIHARPGGEVWVRTSRAGEGRERGIFLALDAFDSDGEFRGAVEIAGPGDESLDRFYFGADNYLVVVHGAERFIRSAGIQGRDEEGHALRLAAYRLVPTDTRSGGDPHGR
ncbi:hypothetical protein KDM41_11070 [bacterium]|nr:hypothetical protein [bacterium]